MLQCDFLFTWVRLTLTVTTLNTVSGLRHWPWLPSLSEDGAKHRPGSRTHKLRCFSNLKRHSVIVSRVSVSQKKFEGFQNTKNSKLFHWLLQWMSVTKTEKIASLVYTAYLTHTVLLYEWLWAQWAAPVNLSHNAAKRQLEAIIKMRLESVV